MKIRCIEIQNYKCHKNTIISNCSDFHTFVGKNSSGKTSILECCQFIKEHTKEIQKIKDIVYGTVTENETKEIIFKLELELSCNERKKYLNSYFGFKNIDELLIPTDILKKLTLEFRISVRGNNVSKENFDNHIIITMMEVLDTKGTFIPIIKQDSSDNKILQISIIEPKKPNSNDAEDISSIDKHMANLANHNHMQKSDKLAFWQSESNFFQNGFVNDFKRQLNVIGSARESKKQVDIRLIENVSEVDERGTNIINLIDTLHHNRPERFDEIENKCKEIFEDIIKIHPKIVEGNKIAIVVRKKNIPYDIDLFQEGIGLDQLLIIIWKIAISEAGTICILDEPELHLHPGAQNLLYEFLKEETQKDKQIFVATHSMVFIHNSQSNEVSIIVNYQQNSLPGAVLLKDLIPEDETSISSDPYEFRKYVYDALGYNPMFAFEPKTIVIVEGKTDKAILTSFAKILGKPVNNRATMLLPLGNAIQAKRYTPIMVYAQAGKKCLIVLDNDKKSPKDIKDEIIKHEKEFRKTVDSKAVLNDDNFYPYPEHVYSIEFYLLEAVAICKAAGGRDDQTLVKNIENEINLKIGDIESKKLKPKEFLRDIWQNNQFGPYDEVNTAEKISEFISRQHLDQYPEIEKLIKVMTA